MHSFVLYYRLSLDTQHSYIDLVLFSAPSQMVACDVIPPLGNSDHNDTHIALKLFQNPSPVKSLKQIIWRCFHANFGKANHLLDAIDCTFLDDRSDIDDIMEQVGGEIYGSYGGMHTQGVTKPGTGRTDA